MQYHQRYAPYADRVAMRKILFLAAVVGSILLVAKTADAQSGAAPLYGVLQGFQQVQQLEAMQLQNELLRLQIERERAEEQRREAAYARALEESRELNQQQFLRSPQPQLSEACAALKSVMEARERYGIVAPSGEKDQEALRRCGLPYSGGSGQPQTTPLRSGSDTNPGPAAPRAVGGRVTCQYYVSPAVCGAR